MIRDYDPARDRQQLRACVVELQESERRLESTLPAGEAMADDYLAFLFRRCAESSGRILVAEVDRVVAGFAGVLASNQPAGNQYRSLGFRLSSGDRPEADA
ncbi:MAG: hypothetical protein A2064_12300 [Spirochaetes bacterium GWB1_66_5]|nr:MAG: hypothetical protein A2064_12300 [Spirochaetes bacterium GWB1_66_5]